MKTKLSLLFLFVVLSVTTVFSQGNELKARMEYEDAEMAFQNEEYEKAVLHLLEVHSLMDRKWTPKAGYLTAIVLDKLTDYGFIPGKRNQTSSEYFAWNEYFVREYMEYAEKNSDKVDLGKMREIYEIEKRINYRKKQIEWEEMPEFKSGQAACYDSNFEESITWLQKASDKGNVSAMLFIGLICYSNKEYNDAMSWFRKAANQGCGLSAAMLTSFFFDFEGHIKQEEARKWTVIAADKGVAIGMLYLAVFYEKEDNCNNVIEWLKKAAYKGSAQAKEGLALLYEKGTCVEKDLNKAIEWRNR